MVYLVVNIYYVAQTNSYFPTNLTQDKCLIAQGRFGVDRGVEFGSQGRSLKARLGSSSGMILALCGIIFTDPSLPDVYALMLVMC